MATGVIAALVAPWQISWLSTLWWRIGRMKADDTCGHVTDTATTDPAALLEAARTMAVDAIALDIVAPTAIGQLIDALAAHHLLRPTWVEIRTSRGERQPRFTGYALVEHDGTLRALADGELVPRD